MGRGGLLAHRIYIYIYFTAQRSLALYIPPNRISTVPIHTQTQSHAYNLFSKNSTESSVHPFDRFMKQARRECSEEIDSLPCETDFVWMSVSFVGENLRYLCVCVLNFLQHNIHLMRLSHSCEIIYIESARLAFTFSKGAHMRKRI